MNIQTQDALGTPGENFFVGRYSRDIFARSKVGGILINKEAVGGAHYNPDVRRGHVAGPASVLHDHRVSREDRDPGRLRWRRGGPGQRALAQPIGQNLRGVHRHPGELQRRGRLRPAGWHSSIEAPWRMASPSGTMGHPVDEPDDEYRLHHRPAQPPVESAHPSHGRGPVRKRLEFHRHLQQAVSNNSTRRFKSVRT